MLGVTAILYIFKKTTLIRPEIATLTSQNTDHDDPLLCKSDESKTPRNTITQSQIGTSKASQIPTGTKCDGVLDQTRS